MYFDLKSRKKGGIVAVTLQGDSLNVRLLDSTNLSMYKRERIHQYYGGHVTRSPYRVAIPWSGHWHLVIDRGGLKGRVRASVLIEPAPQSRLLPPARSLGDLATIRRSVQNVQQELGAEPEYDVFISHATEDKTEVVRPLAEVLRRLGLRVWYDEYELKLGDSLRRKIDHGLVTSRFGVVVLSTLLRQGVVSVRTRRPGQQRDGHWRAGDPSDLAQHHQRRASETKPVPGRQGGTSNRRPDC